MIKIEENLLENINNLVKETFNDTNKMKDFLETLSLMYNISYSNILILKSQRQDISFIISKNDVEKHKYEVKENENPLKKVARIKDKNKQYKYITQEVYDISQLNISNKIESKKSIEYIEKMLKGMCSRRGLQYEENNAMANIENIVNDIKNNCRQENLSKYNLDGYLKQIQIENSATTFVIAKKLGINTRNYNLKDICKWGIENDVNTLKESMRYIQKFTNYFILDYKTQEKINRIENTNEDEEEFE